MALLACPFKTKCSTLKLGPAVRRCIDKAGGLDRYLLKTREDHVQSDLGTKLKAQIHAARQQHQHLPPAAPAGVAEAAEVTPAG